MANQERKDHEVIEHEFKVDTLSKNDSWESFCSVCGISYTDPLILTIYIVYTLRSVLSVTGLHDVKQHNKLDHY